MAFARRRTALATWVALAGGTAFASLAAAQAASPQDQGKLIYSQGSQGAVACVTCHGAQGEGMAAANFPYLAGQGADYLLEQLQHFANGSRNNAVMAPIAKALSAEQQKAVVAYIDTLPAPWDAAQLAAQATTQPDAKDLGAWVANRGDWAHDIPACTQCHAAGGTGVPPHFPAIAGLSKTYIIEQFTLWRKEQRPGGPQDLMGAIARHMNDAQIDAVATYFSALPQNAAPAGSSK